MEITIKINERFVSVEVSAEVVDYLDSKPTRPAHKLLAGGKKVRVCKKCGAEI